MDSLRKRITLPSLGHVSVNFYGAAKLAADLYSKVDEFERQGSINFLAL